MRYYNFWKNIIIFLFKKLIDFRNKNFILRFGVIKKFLIGKCFIIGKSLLIVNLIV